MKYRSEEMTHKKIRIPKESAIEVLSALGKIKNAIEFEDLTKNEYELLFKEMENDLRGEISIN